MGIPWQHLQSFTKTTCTHFWIITGLRVLHIFYCRSSTSSVFHADPSCELDGQSKTVLIDHRHYVSYSGQFLLPPVLLFNKKPPKRHVRYQRTYFTLVTVTNVVSHNVSNMCILPFSAATLLTKIKLPVLSLCSQFFPCGRIKYHLLWSLFTLLERGTIWCLARTTLDGIKVENKVNKVHPPPKSNTKALVMHGDHFKPQTGAPHSITTTER